MATPVMRTPRKVDIDLTAQCNLRCRYCYFFSNPAVEYKDLPTDAWLKFFDELGALGVMEVTLAGGEPFYRKDLRELLDGIVRNRMRFALLSNGGLIDDDIAAFIAQTKRCNYVQVSLDGARAETHDAARGKGAWEGAVRGIRTLQRNKVNVAVRLTIHHNNVDDLEDAARFLLEELHLSGFGTNSAGYLGNCQRHADEMMLTTAERQRAMETLLRLNKKYNGRINAAAGPLAEGQMWRKMEDARATGAPEFPNGGHLTACGCTFNKIAIRADGAIVPCNMLPHIVLGQINRDALQMIWQTAPALNDLRARRAIPLSDFEFCAGCEYQPYCTGNCPGLAYTLTGQVNHPSPDACLRRFLEDGGKLDNPTASR
ncbi:MAG: SynChlorMet cassette radical SAM/SPASM protein ScmE [Anaerolineales bacterium]|nr:SynChlorMet cassette radical SAM/SPASM protein ScmE [Anaerolineales bacterium]